ncbi:MAG: hypothetical protein ACXVC6_08115 [Bacteroidia bacterium]
MSSEEKKILAIQAAKTAVVQLAADVATVCATVQSSGFESEISGLAKNTSELAMQASYGAKSASGLNLRDVEQLASSVSRLSNLLMRQKMQNPLISNDLVGRASLAEKYAMEAVKLTEAAQK